MPHQVQIIDALINAFSQEFFPKQYKWMMYEIFHVRYYGTTCER